MSSVPFLNGRERHGYAGASPVNDADELNQIKSSDYRGTNSLLLYYYSIGASF